MNVLPTPSVLVDYKISLFKSYDVAQILRTTNKPARLPPERAAIALNLAIRRCIGEIGLASASPASEHAAWATQLAEAMQRGLSLLAPGLTVTHAPPKCNIIDAYARLFNAAIHGEQLAPITPPEVDELLKQHGFASPLQALELGAVGLWFIHAFAVHSAAEWKKNVRPTGDMDRRGPEAVRFVMGAEDGRSI